MIGAGDGRIKPLRSRIRRLACFFCSNFLFQGNNIFFSRMVETASSSTFQKQEEKKKKKATRRCYVEGTRGQEVEAPPNEGRNNTGWKRRNKEGPTGSRSFCFRCFFPSLLPPLALCFPRRVCHPVGKKGKKA